jgi:hypothetical protein
MKNYCRIFGFIALAALLWFSVSACGDDSKPTPEPEPLPTYGISLIQTEGSAFTDGTYTFDTGNRSPLSVTVKNTGTAATGRLSIAKIGGNPGTFNLSPTNSIESIPKGGSSVLTVQPIGTLTGGAAYTTKIQISGDNGISESLVVAFTESSGPIYGVALMGNNMPLSSYAFTARAPLTVQAVNSGNRATGALTITTGGTNHGDFTTYPSSLSNIDVGGRTTFTVIPNDNLSNGIHSATITVTGGNSINRSFNVTYIPTVIPGDPTAFEGSWYNSNWTETFTFHVAEGVGTFTKIKDEGWGERGTFTCTETTFICVITDIYDSGSWKLPEPNATLIWPRTYKFEGGNLIINDEHVYVPKATQPGNEPYPHTGGNAPYRIVSIGASFTRDAMSYLRDMLIANGVDTNDIVIVNSYIGGCTLAQHAANAKSGSPAYERMSFGRRGTITSQYGVALQDIIKSSEWDYVNIQQGADQAGNISTYNDEDIEYLIQYVKDNCPNPDVKIIFHMTWAYAKNTTQSVWNTIYGSDQMNMYNMIVNTVQAKIVPYETNGDFAFIIPSGTAIQNARGFFGDTLNSDGYHLNDRGRFIAGAMWLKKIYGLNIDGAFTSDYHALNNFTITLDDMVKIQKSVDDALAHPFEVKD